MEDRPIPLHPIYLNDDDFDHTLPGTYYLVASNGIEPMARNRCTGW